MLGEEHVLCVQKIGGQLLVVPELGRTLSEALETHCLVGETVLGLKV